MGRNTKEIKDLILEILKKHRGNMVVQDLLDEVNKELENGTITQQELDELIESMKEIIRRVNRINNEPERVELAPTILSPVPLSVTRDNIDKLPTGKVGLPPNTNK